MERLAARGLGLLPHTRYQLDKVVYENAATKRAFYRVKHASMPGLTYGLKLLQVDDPREAKTVRHEVTALNRLPFGTSARCHHHWQDGNTHYLLTDWIDGKPLSEIFTRPPQSQQEGLERIKVAEKLASKLANLHRLRVIHRDIKPENVVAQVTGRNVRDVVLIDFGLSNQKRGIEEGTYLYRSPEQGGTRSVSLSGTSDVFSLCQTILFLLTGQPITLEASFNHTDWDTDIVLSLPNWCLPELNDLLVKGLRFNPNDRLKQASTVANGLRDVSRKMNARRAR
ncbi:serine/threonine protein kinase [Ferrimonas pelagia]|uniref:non-specific serine/threonine protein kinase n=1 Tax=Ferrimonas pelagia TaxID=1177826 RepID=A0ABP9EYP0_9GAMM